MRLRNADQRRESNEFLIDGKREIELALSAGLRIRTLFIPVEDEAECLDWQRNEWFNNVSAIQPLGARALKRVTYGQRERDWVAIAEIERHHLADLQLPAQPLLLILDRIEKPGNIGACLRTAAACGVAAVLMTDSVCDLFNPNVIRSSRGAIFRTPVVETSAEQAIQWLRARGIPIFSAQVDGAKSLWQCSLSGSAAICVGNEASGLQAIWKSAEHHSYRIPMHGDIDSLNVSISAAVSLYEAFRQRETNQPS